jgi:hypothetical protein
MSANQQLTESLLSVAGFLRCQGEQSRAGAFSALASSPSDPAIRVNAVLGAFDGAGSFNDLVLRRHGEVIIDENSELDRLRHHLWDAAIAVLVAEEHALHADELKLGMIERIRRIRLRYDCSLSTTKEVAIVAAGEAKSLRDHIENLFHGSEADLDLRPTDDHP